MQGEKLALRYAHSIIDHANGNNSLDKLKGDVDMVQNALDGSKELLLLIRNPLIHYSKKLTVIDKIFKGKVGDDFLQFMHVIFRKGREVFLAEILQQIIKLYNKQKGIMDVKATFASAPSDTLKADLKSALEQKLKGTVTLTTEIKPEIIGGFAVQYNDVLFDATVSGRINQLKQALKTN